MPDSYLPVVVAPLRGVADSIQAKLVPDDKCVDARNFLFYKGNIVTRPQLVSTGVALPGTAIQPHCAIGLLVGNLGTDLVLTTANGLFETPSGQNAWNPLTGAGFTAPDFLKGVACYKASAPGQIVLLNNKSGLTVWDPNGIATPPNQYTVLANPSPAPRFVKAHLGRAIAAGDNTSYFTQGASTFYWAVIGDPFTWTGATNGSGSTILSDVNDAISGLEVINNVVVLCRTGGFTLAIPTGLGFPPYRFETWSRESIGATQPTTVAVYDNKIFFGGANNIYTFDLNQVTPIGDEITEGYTSTVGNNQYTGFITEDVFGITPGLVPRPLYHLMCFNAGVHYIYDIREGNWSKHNYAPGLLWQAAFAGYKVTFDSKARLPYFINNSTGLFQWNANNACEQVQTFTSKIIQVGDDPSVDRQLERVLIEWYDINNATVSVTITVTATLQDSAVTTTASQNLVGTNSTRLLRKYVDVGRLVGQNFQVTVSLPANSGFWRITQVVLLFDKSSGVMRG